MEMQFVTVNRMEMGDQFGSGVQCQIGVAKHLHTRTMVNQILTTRSIVVLMVIYMDENKIRNTN